MKWCITLQILFFAWITAAAQLFVKHEATGNLDGITWANVFTDLQDALDAASPGSQIWIAAVTYVPGGSTPDSSHFISLESLEFYGSFIRTESRLPKGN